MVERTVAEALAYVDSLIARHAPYEQVMESLDECAAMPGASEVMPGIGQRRVAATDLYDRGEEERERELLAFLAIEQPLQYRASTTIAACAASRGLAERYLPRLILELERAASDEGIKFQLDGAYQVRDRLGIGHTTAAQGLTVAQRLIAREAPYTTIMEALETSRRMPDADKFMPAIAATHLEAARFYGRSEAEQEMALVEYLAAAGSVPLADRVVTVIAACEHNDRLVYEYLPPLIAEMEAASDRESVSDALQRAQRLCERMGIIYDHDAEPVDLASRRAELELDIKWRTAIDEGYHGTSLRALCRAWVSRHDAIEGQGDEDGLIRVVIERTQARDYAGAALALSRLCEMNEQVRRMSS